MGVGLLCTKASTDGLNGIHTSYSSQFERRKKHEKVGWISRIALQIRHAFKLIGCHLLQN